MWLSRLALVLTLAACGFTPVYGPGGTGNTLQGRVAFGEPSDRATYALVRRMEERLGRTVDPAYDLGVTLDSQQEALAISADGSIERYQLLGTLHYTLTDRSTGAQVADGSVSNFTGYSASGSTVATLQAQRDAQARLVTILADMLTDRLLTTAL